MSIDGKTWPRGTVWDHGDHNGRHERFSLSCDEYRRLVARGNGRCEVCLRPTAPDELVIDHDHSISFRAVRGLACTLCNIGLGQVDNGWRSADEHEIRYLGSPFHLTIPATRPRLAPGTAPYSRPAAGRFGSARCPRCRRTVNLDQHGDLNGHLGRVGKERSRHGDSACHGWSRWRPMICHHGSSITDRDNLCRRCWRCDCTSGEAANCPQHGVWTTETLVPVMPGAQGT